MKSKIQCNIKKVNAQLYIFIKQDVSGGHDGPGKDIIY